MNDFKFPQLDKLVGWFCDEHTRYNFDEDFKLSLKIFMDEIIADTVAIVERKEK